METPLSNEEAAEPGEGWADVCGGGGKWREKQQKNNNKQQTQTKQRKH